jgi:hypothetical protein
VLVALLHILISHVCCSPYCCHGVEIGCGGEQVFSASSINSCGSEGTDIKHQIQLDGEKVRATRRQFKPSLLVESDMLPAGSILQGIVPDVKMGSLADSDYVDRNEHPREGHLPADSYSSCVYRYFGLVYRESDDT